MEPLPSEDPDFYLEALDLDKHIYDYHTIWSDARTLVMSTQKPKRSLTASRSWMYNASNLKSPRIHNYAIILRPESQLNPSNPASRFWPAPDVSLYAQEDPPEDLPVDPPEETSAGGAEQDGVKAGKPQPGLTSGNNSLEQASSSTSKQPPAEQTPSSQPTKGENIFPPAPAHITTFTPPLPPSRSSPRPYMIGLVGVIVPSPLSCDPEPVGPGKHNRGNEIGYMLSATHWGCGLATRAVREFVGLWWRELNPATQLELHDPKREVVALDTLEAYIDPENPGSESVARKAGFKETLRWGMVYERAQDGGRRGRNRVWRAWRENMPEGVVAEVERREVEEGRRYEEEKNN